MLWLPLFKILYNVHFKITVNFVYKRTKHQRVPSREGVTGSFKFFNGNPQVESHCYDVTIKTSVCVFFFSLFRFNFILFWNDVYIYISKHSLNWINPPPQKKIIKKNHILSNCFCRHLYATVFTAHQEANTQVNIQPNYHYYTWLYCTLCLRPWSVLFDIEVATGWSSLTRMF